MEDIPEEILVKILQYVDILDLISISACSSVLRRLAIYIYSQRLYFFPVSKSLESIKTIQPIPFLKQIQSLQRKKDFTSYEICVMMLYVEEECFMLLGTAKDCIFHNCNPKFKISNPAGRLEFSDNAETYVFFENIIVDEVLEISADKSNVFLTQNEHTFPMYGKLKFCLIPTPDILQNKRHFAPVKKGIVAVDTEKKLQMLLQVIDKYSGEHYEETNDEIYDRAVILDYYPLF